MSKVYVVCWGNARQDDCYDTVAYGNVHGVYHSREKAEAGLEECKEDFVEEIVNNPDFDEEDRERATQNLSIYGSVEEGYFELDRLASDACAIVEQTYIQIVETELN